MLNDATNYTAVRLNKQISHINHSKIPVSKEPKYFPLLIGYTRQFCDLKWDFHDAKIKPRYSDGMCASGPLLTLPGASFRNSKLLVGILHKVNNLGLLGPLFWTEWISRTRCHVVCSLENSECICPGRQLFFVWICCTRFCNNPFLSVTYSVEMHWLSLVGKWMQET